MLTATQTHNTASQIMALFATMPFGEQSRLIDNLSHEYERRATLRTRFEKLYEQWWRETCVYSGRNLAMNSTYYKIVDLGTPIIDFLDNLLLTEPDYKHRHIQWLKTGVCKTQK
ncbi:MAG: hypothetical protein II956_08090 [Bacteroidales bacterium]|nr:hypothetical protein [Bacteroidales bacterium]